MYGNQRKKVKKERVVDTAQSEHAIRLEKLAELDDDQLRADITIDNLALAFDKNAKILEVSDVIARSEPEVYISIPSAERDNSQETYQVRLALQRGYQAESEFGTVIRYPLFKRIVDAAAQRQESVVEYLRSIGDLNSQLNEINIGNLYGLLNNNIQVDQYVDNEAPDGGKAESALWKQLGVAFLAFLLMDQFHKIAPMFTAKKDLEDETKDADADVAATKDPAEKAAKRARLILKIQLILIRVAEAVVLFAIAHGLTKAQTTVLAAKVLPPDVDEGLKAEYEEKIREIYDNPPDEIKQMMLPETDDDEIIFSYAMRQIDIQKSQKNFTPWLIYAIAVIRKLQMGDIATSLDGTSNEADKLERIINESQLDTSWRAPGYTIEREIVRSEISPNFVSTRSLRGVDRPLSSRGPDLRVPVLIDPDRPISKYANGTGKALDFNISSYIHESNAYAARSGATSDYYMSLMQNNKYTPELVCCLLKFLADDLDFLKNMSSVLKAFGNGFKIDYGSLLEDIVNGLFGDLKTKIMSYAISELAKLMGKIKEPILEWIDNLEREHQFIAFCTPIIDMAKLLLRIITEFEALLQDFIEEILGALLTFELQIEDGVITMNGTTRYRNIIGILDAIIFALENGQLCNTDSLAPSDIHPDALPIIDRFSAQPSGDIQSAVQSNKALYDAINKKGALSNDSSLSLVHPFEDPKDPELKPAVSIHRTYVGESLVETIDRYSANCGAFRYRASELLRGLI